MQIMDKLQTFFLSRLYNKVSSHVDKIIKTQFKRPQTTTTPPPPINDPTVKCVLQDGCTGDLCHQDCSGNSLKKKCLPLKKIFSSGDGVGVCVECTADNHCSTSGKLRCDKFISGVGNGQMLPTFTCTGGTTSLEPYMHLKEANEVIFKPMNWNEHKITNVQSSGASIAELFSDTRYISV